MTDKNTLDLARQWAADIDADRQTLSQDTIDAAADLISSLPDAWVDAKELRDVIHKATWQGVVMEHMREQIVDDLEDLLPDPPAPRTMAEIEWSFSEHHRAEAEHSVYGKVVMMELDDTGDIVVLMDEGLLSVTPSALTPTGRKLRLIPDEDAPEGDPIEIAGDDHASNCASCAEMDDDEPDFDPAYIYRDKDGDEWEHLDGRWVTGDTHAERVDTREGMSGHDSPPAEYGPYRKGRLVPETTEQDDEPDFDPAYIYRDKDGDVWRYRDEAW